ncbi:MAG: metallophosphoesterase [Candidatus Hodarchaeota archaeon]
MKVMAFSDIHGSVEAIEEAVGYIKDREDIESIIIAGDFASINYDSRKNDAVFYEEEKIRKIFHLIEKIGVKYYFVWGNRDSFFFMDLPPHYMSPKNTGIKFLESLNLKNGKCLHQYKWLPISEKFRITTDPKFVDDRTIYVTHWQKGIQTNALLHLEGHVHYGQVKDNYVNLCFLFRDSLHGAESLLGGIWEIDVNYENLNIEFIDLGNNVREIICPNHREEGVFYIPKYWRKCPVCYDITNAKFLFSVSTSG